MPSPKFGPILNDRPFYFKRSVRAGVFDLRLPAPRLIFRTMEANGVVKRSVRIAGHATSISLEREFWEALGEIARRRQLSVAALVAAIDAGRGGSLSSAIRLHVLDSARRGELREG